MSRIPPPKQARSSRPPEWGAWEWRNHLAGHPLAVNGMFACCLNKVYSVQFFRHETDWGEVLHLMVRRHDGQTVRNWYDLQVIKDDLVAPERTAIEVFPPASELVDVAPIYHLWVLPEDMHLPFSLDAMGSTIVRTKAVLS